MTTLYIREQGTSIQKHSERLLISKSRQILLEIPMDNIDGVAVIGNIQMTTPALHALMRRGINISYFSFSGNYLGSMTSDTSKNIFLRLAQYDFYRDADKRMKLARKIIINKIKNQLQLMESFRWEPGEKEYLESIQSMKTLIKRAQDMATISELMGVEGKASNIYFKTYGKMFKCKCEFHGRNKRPPRDPINVIISLGYTFLTKEVSSALEAESFEMYLGFLHGIRYGRKSLPLDMVEEFRQPIIDRMTLKLFNKRMIQEFDFTLEGDVPTLSEEGFRKFCREFERWMSESDISGEGVGYRGLIQRQAKRLKAAVQKKEGYDPYCLRKKHYI